MKIKNSKIKMQNLGIPVSPSLAGFHRNDYIILHFALIPMHKPVLLQEVLEYLNQKVDK